MWQFIWYVLLLLYIPSCIGLIVIVLLQKGKGVGFAGAFGVGSGSDTVFGPRMTKTLPQRLTYVMAGLFMVIAFVMSMISGRLTKGAAPDVVAKDAIVQPDLSGMEDLGSAVEKTPAPAAPGAETAPVPEAAPAAAPAPEAVAPASEAVAPAPEAVAPAPEPAPAPEAPAQQ